LNIQQAEQDMQDLLRQHGLLDKWQSYREQQLKRIAKREAVHQKQVLGFKLLFVMLFASALLAGCQDRYRFPCQDPKNWNLEKCTPPQCKADETCTEYLIRIPDES
jgi:hypothetical protein